MLDVWTRSVFSFLSAIEWECCVYDSEQILSFVCCIAEQNQPETPKNRTKHGLKLDPTEATVQHSNKYSYSGVHLGHSFWFFIQMSWCFSANLFLPWKSLITKLHIYTHTQCVLYAMHWMESIRIAPQENRYLLFQIEIRWSFQVRRNTVWHFGQEWEPVEKKHKTFHIGSAWRYC